MHTGISFAGFSARRRALEMKAKRIGVLMGGLSAERDVSLKSGEAVHAALVDRGYDAVPVFVDRDLDLALRQARVDAAFLALHGRYGEDGCVQGLLELMGIQYTGSDVLASALAMNKVKAKEIFRLHNLGTPAYYLLPRSQADAVAEEHGGFGYPAVVKPCGEGSSVGVTVVHDLAELEAAVEVAFRFDDQVLVERFVEGMEVSVAILNDRPLGAIEIKALGGGFFDYAHKYTPGKTEFAMPARLSPERYRGVLTQALAAHQALGCAGASRVDMMVSERGNELVLEVNTLPGLAPTSLLPRIAAHAGLAFEDLCEEILGAARLWAHGRGRRDRRIAQRPFDGPERRQTDVARTH
jgi:D-alanine-D-alanine ligase